MTNPTPKEVEDRLFAWWWLYDDGCANLQDLGPIVMDMLEQARADERKKKSCGCAWCCATVPPDQRGEIHQRTCACDTAE